MMAMSEIQRKALNSRVAKSFINCLESQLFPDWRRNEKRVAAAVVVGVSVPHGFIFSSESLLDRERKREREFWSFCFACWYLTFWSHCFKRIERETRAVQIHVSGVRSKYLSLSKY